MSNSIPVSFIQEYSAGIELLAQQMTSKTREAVLTGGMSSKKKSEDQIGVVAMKPRGARHADIPTVDTPHKRRWCSAADWHIRDFVDQFDVVQTLNNPTNGYSQAFAAAAARTYDKTAIDGMLGTNYVGEEGTTPITFPTSQIIEEGGGGSGFTMAKLKAAVTKLKTNNAVMPGDTIHAFWTAKQETEFTNESDVKSIDFNNVRVLVDGGVNEFYKVRFHLIEDVEDSDDGRMLPKTGNIRQIPLFCRSGVRVRERVPAYGRIAWIDERETWQVSAGISVGATRLQEKKVTRIDVVESA